MRLLDILYSLARCSFVLHDIKKELFRLKHFFKKRDVINSSCASYVNTFKIASLLNSRHVCGVNKNHIKTIKHDTIIPGTILNILNSNKIKLLGYRIYSNIHPVFDRILIPKEKKSGGDKILVCGIDETLKGVKLAVEHLLVRW